MVAVILSMLYFTRGGLSNYAAVRVKLEQAVAALFVPAHVHKAPAVLVHC